jgi:purine nucleosidase
MNKKITALFSLVLLLIVAYNINITAMPKKTTNKIPVVFDTDTNNELDDQHALAYLLFSGNTFAVKGVTVNATSGGGNVDEQYAEAERILKLARENGNIPLFKGANGNFEQIRKEISNSHFDGDSAVNFIINQIKSNPDTPLVLIAVGKLTNVALALQKDPSIIKKVRVVWLGSNYPEPGEYNMDNDTAAMNYVLNINVPFEMVTVRYGKPSGTDAVRVTPQEINQHMPGRGPKVATPVVGRHQAAFTTFGDYSINLFQHITYNGNPPGRALYDMAAVAIVKNPSWASVREIPAPILQNNTWVERHGNPRKIKVWENFKKDAILQDFYNTMEHYVLAGRE